MKFNRANTSFYSAVAFLICTVIGAGIFGLPYVVAKAGFFVGIFYFVVLSVITIVITFSFSDIVLATKTRHQLPGYAQIYLGKAGKIIALFSILTAFIGALTAYILGVGDFLSNIFGGDEKLWGLIFSFFASIAVYYGLKIITAIEKKISILIIIIVLIIFIFSFSKINPANLVGFSWQYFFLPYGVILFALGGATAVPDMALILKRNARLLKRAILYGLILPQIIYLLFVVAVVGIAGNSTSLDAVRSLSLVGGWLVILGSALGVLTMGTSFLTSGLILREILTLDVGLSKKQSWIISMGLPVALACFGFLNFIQILGIAGAITSGFDSILIMLIHQQIKKVAYSKLKAGLVYTVFGLGILYQAYIFL